MLRLFESGDELDVSREGGLALIVLSISGAPVIFSEFLARRDGPNCRLRPDRR
jgi:hypothetical protein